MEDTFGGVTVGVQVGEPPAREDVLLDHGFHEGGLPGARGPHEVAVLEAEARRQGTGDEPVRAVGILGEAQPQAILRAVLMTVEGLPEALVEPDGQGLEKLHLPGLLNFL